MRGPMACIQSFDHTDTRAAFRSAAFAQTQTHSRSIACQSALLSSALHTQSSFSDLKSLNLNYTMTASDPPASPSSNISSKVEGCLFSDYSPSFATAPPLTASVVGPASRHSLNSPTPSVLCLEPTSTAPPGHSPSSTAAPAPIPRQQRHVQ